MADRGNIADLPIPATAGLIEPTHVVPAPEPSVLGASGWRMQWLAVWPMS